MRHTSEQGQARRLASFLLATNSVLKYIVQINALSKRGGEHGSRQKAGRVSRSSEHRSRRHGGWSQPAPRLQEQVGLPCSRRWGEASAPHEPAYDERLHVFLYLLRHAPR